MFDLIRKIFKKNVDSMPAPALKPQLPPSTIEGDTEEQILSFCREVADLLQIDLPQINFYGLIYTSQGIVQCQFNFDANSLPHDTEPHGAYYFDDRNLIIISSNIPRLERKGKGFIYTYKEATMAEMIFICCHELRHVWQRKYHDGLYYGHNAVGDEILNDIAEVDADAFALAYVFSTTDYKVKDLPTQLQQVSLQATLDHGKRWKRSKLLYKEYRFGNPSEITKLKHQLDLKYADLLQSIDKPGIR